MTRYEHASPFSHGSQQLREASVRIGSRNGLLHARFSFDVVIFTTIHPLLKDERTSGWVAGWAWCRQVVVPDAGVTPGRDPCSCGRFEAAGFPARARTFARASVTGLSDGKSAESLEFPRDSGHCSGRFSPPSIQRRKRQKSLEILGIWRREWDSDSPASFRFCKLQILKCRRCRRCLRCRGALPAIARTVELAATEKTTQPKPLEWCERLVVRFRAVS